MTDRQTILIVDDDPNLCEVLREHIQVLGYTALTVSSGAEALDVLDHTPVDLVMTDLHMSGMTGIELCTQIKEDPRFTFLPVILLTALSDLDSRVAGLSAGADDFFTKPFNSLELRTRIEVLLRVRARVQDQLLQLERLSRLKRFLAPQLADLIVTSGATDPLRTHRCDVTVVFIDLRGFTAFTETSEPEEVMTVLHEYHAVMGHLITAHEGTLERYTGDGMMILFNDPLPVANPVERAIRMAVAMRAHERELSLKWQRRGFDLNFGIGIAQGYATIGKIGFEDRWDYTAIGSVVNLAARLCGVARAGEILIPERMFWTVENSIDAEFIGEFELKGFKRGVRTYRVLGMKAEDLAKRTG